MIGDSAAATGKALSDIGFSIENVVRGYGDLCQAITELAFEFDAPFTIPHFRILNLCIDTAIANAVKAFTAERESALEAKSAALIADSGIVAHEMRNLIHTALLAFSALKTGNLSAAGSTGLLAERSILALGKYADRMLRDVEAATNVPQVTEIIALAPFFAEIEAVTKLATAGRGINFSVIPIDPRITVYGSRELLYEAVTNLVQNALKFTKPNSAVTVRIYTTTAVFIEVRDHCGGLVVSDNQILFDPFVQASHDRSGLGLGLTIVKRNVEAMRGTVAVTNFPGHGCAFTIQLPLAEG